MESLETDAVVVEDSRGVSEEQKGTPSWISVVCFRCDNTVEVHGDWSGQSLDCPVCQGAVDLPEKGSSSLRKRTCTSCNTQTHFVFEGKGQHGSCPVCRALIPPLRKRARMRLVRAKFKSVLPGSLFGKKRKPVYVVSPLKRKLSKKVASAVVVKEEPEHPAQPVAPAAEVLESVMPKQRDKGADETRKTRATELRERRRLASEQRLQERGELDKLSQLQAAAQALLSAEMPRSMELPKSLLNNKELLADFERAMSLLKEESSTAGNNATQEPEIKSLALAEKRRRPVSRRSPVTSAAKRASWKISEAAHLAGRGVSDALAFPFIRTAHSFHRAKDWFLVQVLSRLSPSTRRLLQMVSVVLVLAAIVGGGILAPVYLRQRASVNAGFTSWSDFQLHEKATRMIQQGKLGEAMLMIEPRALQKSADLPLKTLYYEIRAALNRKPFSLAEITRLLSSDREKGVQVLALPLVWEGAWRGTSENRIKNADLLSKMARDGSLTGLLSPLSVLLSRPPEEVFGERPMGMAGFKWDEHAGDWHRIQAQYGERASRKTLLEWMETEGQDRNRREIACRMLLKLKDESSVLHGMDLFAELSDAISYRVQQTHRLRPMSDGERVPEELRRWATADLAKTIAETHGLLHKAGRVEGMKRLQESAKTDALYGEMAMAAAHEIVSLHGADALPAVKEIQSYWQAYLNKLSATKAAGTSEEIKTFQNIAKRILAVLDNEMARAGDADTRVRLREKWQQGSDFDKVRLGLEWGRNGLDIAIPALQIMSAEGPSAAQGLIVSPSEREEAAELLLTQGGEESSEHIKKFFSSAMPDQRYLAAWRLTVLQNAKNKAASRPQTQK